jgi:hypothetical protein
MFYRTYPSFATSANSQEDKDKWETSMRRLVLEFSLSEFRIPFPKVWPMQ